MCISVHQLDMQLYALKCLCSYLWFIWWYLCATVSPSTVFWNISFTLKTMVWFIRNLNARCSLPRIQIVPTTIVAQYKVTGMALMKISHVLPYISDKMLYTSIWGAVPTFLINILIIECFGLEGTFRGHPAHPPCSEQGLLQLHIRHNVRLFRAPSNLALNDSKDGASATSLSNLGQCFTTLSVKNFFLLSYLNLPSLSLKSWSLVLSQQALLISLSFSSMPVNDLYKSTLFEISQVSPPEDIHNNSFLKAQGKQGHWCFY